MSDKLTNLMSLNWRVRIVLIATSLCLGLLLWWAFFLRSYGKAVLSTGQEGGTYTVLGTEFSGIVRTGKNRFELEVVGSKGTVQNLSLLEKGEVDFAFVQSGLEGSQRVRTVAKLYDEVLHVMVHRDSGRTHLSDLKGACISLGAKGSGSRVVGIDLLEHFGVEVFQEKPLEPREAIEALKKKEIDAVFLVTALQSEVVRDAMGEGQVRFVNLAEGSAGVVARYPHLIEAEIPARAYRCLSEERGAMPMNDIQTIGVPSLLVCREGLSSELVYEVTKSLFASRSELVRSIPEAYQISEISSVDLLPWPLHEGAQRYYRRREPSFLERYAELMAFLMSVMAAAWAIFGTISKWSSRRKKNRIDFYYVEVASAFLRLEEGLSLESLKEERARLRKLRSQAFKELAREQLKADESFRIFQDQLALCLDDIRRREESSEV